MSEKSERAQLVDDLYEFCAEHGLTSGPTEWSPKLFKLAGKPPYRAFGISIPAVLDGTVKVYSDSWILAVWSFRRRHESEVFKSVGAFKDWVFKGGWTGVPGLEEE